TAMPNRTIAANTRAGGYLLGVMGESHGKGHAPDQRVAVRRGSGREAVGAAAGLPGADGRSEAMLERTGSGSFTAWPPPMLQLPVNTAPGSMESFLVKMSPVSLAVAFSESRSWQAILPFTVPSMSLLWQCTSPSTSPEVPTIRRPRT